MHVVSVEFIEYSALQPVHDISIEADASFLLLNGVIAHNSSICLARHGRRYDVVTHAPVGHRLPYLTGPPYHNGCRSTIMTVLATGGGVAQEDAAQWLRRQGAAMQEAVLGSTRAQLFHDKKLTLRQLLDAATGRPLTLEELGV